MKNWIINILTTIIRFFIKNAPPAVANNLSDDFLSKIDQYNNGFNSIFFRPKTAEQVKLESNYQPFKEKIAITIQGPFVFKDDFTIETIKLYKKNYPNHLIIVSTWDDLLPKVQQDVRALGVELLLNKKPISFGALNVNLQIVSTKNAIIKAKEMGSQFVYKTRSDQRFYAIDISHFLLEILKKNKPKNPLNYKLVSANMTTLKYRPYGVGDMFMFGQIDDMLLYWDSKLDDRTITKNLVPKTTIFETAKLRLAETGLCLNFLDKINYPYNFTLEDTHKVYNDFFYIIDYETLNLFWYKYEWRNESRYQFYQKHTFELFREKENFINTSCKQANIEEYLLQNEGQRL